MKEELLTGDLLDEQGDLSLQELCRVCSKETSTIIELVEEGILQPSGHAQATWSFSAVSIVRVKQSERLQRDLGVNLPGVALVLELLEELEQLRSRLEVLQRP